MGKITRRHFLQQSAATAGLLIGAPYLLASEPAPGKRSASDLVPLGKSGIKFSRLGFGTGTVSGKVQRDLGQKEFTRLVRYAYDHGIRYFDTAESYRGMHQMLAEALKGVDRGTYTIQTKIHPGKETKIQEVLDRFRKELNTEYVDSLLLHYMNRSGWVSDMKRFQDDYSEAKDKKIIRMHGASCHGYDALKEFAGCSWLDLALLRVNHAGAHMDGLGAKLDDPTNHDQAVSEIKKIHAAGIGVIGMKIMGEGEFTKPEDRDASIKFVMGLNAVDVVVIGFKSTAEIDEAIERMNKHLNA